MKSIAAPEFWELYHRLSPEIRKLADKNYKLWLANPRHGSLHFKKVGKWLWSAARVGEHYRAVAYHEGEAFRMGVDRTA